MATQDSKKFYWLKLYNDLFTSKRIKRLRNMGADFVIIYLKMQLASLEHDGYLEITGIAESVADEIALEIDEDPDKIQLTISYLQACGLLETNTDSIYLPYVEKCTGSETGAAKRKREYRKAVEVKSRQALTDNGGTNGGQCPLEKEIEKEKEIDIYIDLYKQVVEYLNQNCNTSYKTSTRKTKDLIKARANEGFTLDDFKKVIDNKAAEWLGDEKMQKFLRPETLFGNKFEGYLNQQPVTKKAQKQQVGGDYNMDELSKLLYQ